MPGDGHVHRVDRRRRHRASRRARPRRRRRPRGRSPGTRRACPLARPRRPGRPRGRRGGGTWRRRRSRRRARARLGQAFERAERGGRRLRRGRRPARPASGRARRGTRRGTRGLRRGSRGGIAQLSSCSRHRSTAVTVSRRTSSVCSPRSGGGSRVSSTPPSKRIGFRTSRSVVARPGRPPPRPARRPPARRTPRPSSGSERVGTDAASSAATHSSALFVANDLGEERDQLRRDGARDPRSSRTEDRLPTPGCPRTSHVRRNNRSFAGGDDERTIRRVERLVRADVRVGRAHRPRDHAAEQVVGRLVHHRGRAGIEERHADVSPATGPLALVQRGEDADRHLRARDDVEESDPRLHRFPVRARRSRS